MHDLPQGFAGRCVVSIRGPRIDPCRTSQKGGAQEEEASGGKTWWSTVSKAELRNILRSKSIYHNLKPQTNTENQWTELRRPNWKRKTFVVHHTCYRQAHWFMKSVENSLPSCQCDFIFLSVLVYCSIYAFWVVFCSTSYLLCFHTTRDLWCQRRHLAFVRGKTM